MSMRWSILRRAVSAIVGLLVVSVFASAQGAPVPAEKGAGEQVVWLDGRRESVERVVVKADHVLVKIDGRTRRVARRSVVAVVRASGESKPVEPTVSSAPIDATQRSLLDRLGNASPPEAPAIQTALADRPSRATLDALARLTKAGSPEARARAAEVLLLSATPDGFDAAVALLRSDAPIATRERVATSLSRVVGAIRVRGWGPRLAPLLTDRHRGVRIAVALALGHAGVADAAAVLKKDGLRDRDHHVREAAAEALATLGDASGVRILLKMLTRTKHPAMTTAADRKDPTLVRIMIDEKVRVCRLLGALRATTAKAALTKAARSQHADLAAAAKRALDAIVGAG